jgi:hypothetical protein
VVRVAGGHLEMDIQRTYRSTSNLSGSSRSSSSDCTQGWVLRALVCLFGTIHPKQQQQLAVVPTSHGLVQVTTQAQSAGELIYAAAVHCASLRNAQPMCPRTSHTHEIKLSSNVRYNLHQRVCIYQ